MRSKCQEHAPTRGPRKSAKGRSRDKGKGECFAPFVSKTLFFEIKSSFSAMKIIRNIFLLKFEIFKISSKIQFFITYFLSNPFCSKTFFFDLQTKFFDQTTVFFRFLAEIRLRMLIKSPQKVSSRPKTYKFRTTCTLP